VGHGKCSHENYFTEGESQAFHPGRPRGLDSLKATAVSPHQGEEEPHPAGRATTARSKRTVQAPGRPTFLLGRHRSDGDPVITLRGAARWWMRARPADATQVVPHRRSIHAEVNRRQGTTGAVVDGNGGVGGLHTLHTRFDAGERGGARTRPSKGGPCGAERATARRVYNINIVYRLRDDKDATAAWHRIRVVVRGCPPPRRFAPPLPPSLCSAGAGCV